MKRMKEKSEEKNSKTISQFRGKIEERKEKEKRKENNERESEKERREIKEW